MIVRAGTDAEGPKPSKVRVRSQGNATNAWYTWNKGLSLKSIQATPARASLLLSYAP